MIRRQTRAVAPTADFMIFTGEDGTVAKIDKGTMDVEISGMIIDSDNRVLIDLNFQTDFDGEPLRHIGTEFSASMPVQAIDNRTGYLLGNGDVKDYKGDAIGTEITSDTPSSWLSNPCFEGTVPHQPDDKVPCSRWINLVGLVDLSGSNGFCKLRVQISPFSVETVDNDEITINGTFDEIFDTNRTIIVESDGIISAAFDDLRAGGIRLRYESGDEISGGTIEGVIGYHYK
jgi:hypothetical protein